MDNPVREYMINTWMDDAFTTSVWLQIELKRSFKPLEVQAVIMMDHPFLK